MCHGQAPLQDQAMGKSWVRVACCHLQHTPPRLLCLPRPALQTWSCTMADRILCRVSVTKVSCEGCALWDEDSIEPCCHFWATMKPVMKALTCEELSILLCFHVNLLCCTGGEGPSGSGLHTNDTLPGSTQQQQYLPHASGPAFFQPPSGHTPTQSRAASGEGQQPYLNGRAPPTVRNSPVSMSQVRVTVRGTASKLNQGSHWSTFPSAGKSCER